MRGVHEFHAAILAQKLVATLTRSHDSIPPEVYPGAGYFMPPIDGFKTILARCNNVFAALRHSSECQRTLRQPSYRKPDRTLTVTFINLFEVLKFIAALL